MRLLNLRRSKGWGVGVAAAVVFAYPSMAQEAWVAVRLHPAGASQSWATGFDGSVQVGSAAFGVVHAGTWRGNSASWQSLHSTSVTSSQVLGAGSGQRVGGVGVAMEDHAALWSAEGGSALVDLHPDGSAFSEALDAGGMQQVGNAGVIEAGGSVRQHASLWEGSADSWVDLHPAGFEVSFATGVDAGTQVGWVQDSIIASPAQRIEASIWSGSATSWRSVHPPGSAGSSAWSVYGDFQVGVAEVSGENHAALWNGSAGTWVDLHPNGAAMSWAKSVWGRKQAGWVITGGRQVAACWSGGPTSFVNLHASLPGGYASSQATGVWSDGVHTFVTGFATTSDASNHAEAFLWVGPAGCACPADLDCDAALAINDLVLFLLYFLEGTSGADFDNGSGTGALDGAVTVDDLVFYLAHFEGGC